MRSLTVEVFLTVDGWAKGTASPAFFGFGGPELDAWIGEQARTPQTMLMGAVTYRALSSVGDPAAGVPKVVFSRSLDGPPAWPDTTIVRADAVAAVAAMKAEPGAALRVIGSLSLGRSLLRAGLVERYRLLLFPQVLGTTGAEPAFAGLPDLTLDLRATTVLDGRIVVLEYAPA